MSDGEWYFYTDGNRKVPPNASHLLIASNVLDIPSSLCAGNQCLKSVHFQPNSVCRGIGASAFYNCPNLEFVELSPTVRLVGFMAFQDCPRLKILTLDHRNNNANMKDDQQPQAITTRRKFGFGFQCFKNATSLTEVSIIEGIRSVSESCFEGCSGLRRISLPNTVEHLMKKAFKSCTNLEIAILNEGLKSISDEVFRNCEKLESMPVPCTVERIGTRAFASCTNLESLEIVGLDNRLKTIEEEAFAHCKKLESMPIPCTVDRIGRMAFVSCTNLENLEIVGVDSKLRLIENEAFAHCEKLRAVPILDSVQRVGSRAFQNCRMLGSVEFKNGSKLWFGDDIFRGCSNLIWIVVQYETYKRHYNRFHFPAEMFNQCPPMDSRRNQSTEYIPVDHRFDSYKCHANSFLASFDSQGDNATVEERISINERIQSFISKYSDASQAADHNTTTARLDETLKRLQRKSRCTLTDNNFVVTTRGGVNLFHIIASSTHPHQNQFHERLDSLPIRLLFQQDKILGLTPLMLLAENSSAEAHDLLLSLIPKLVTFSSSSQ